MGRPLSGPSLLRVLHPSAAAISRAPEYYLTIRAVPVNDVAQVIGTSSAIEADTYKTRIREDKERDRFSYESGNISSVYILKDGQKSTTFQ